MHVAINLYKSATLGVTFTYPLGWTVGRDDPFELDTFEHAYEGGGIIPMGGAEIDMAKTSLDTSLDAFVKANLVSATISSTGTIPVGGVSCTEVFYKNTFAPGVGSQNVAVFCPKAGSVLEIYLSYRAGDPKWQDHVTGLNHILASLQFSF